MIEEGDAGGGRTGRWLFTRSREGPALCSGTCRRRTAIEFLPAWGTPKAQRGRMVDRFEESEGPRGGRHVA